MLTRQGLSEGAKSRHTGLATSLKFGAGPRVGTIDGIGTPGCPRGRAPVAVSRASRGLPEPHLLHEVDEGSHFAAWEVPELFASEMRGAFSSLR
jgi:hypothetical protein